MRKKKRVILLLLTLLIIGAIKAEAVLDVTFKEGASNKDLAINQIQYYWSGDASGANQNSRIINPDPTISFDLADPNKQAKTAYEAPPTDKYVFGASASYPNSGTTKVRVWDTAAQSEGGKYTDLASYTNPFGSGSSQIFSIVYKYIKATPTTAWIYQIAETGSTVLEPPPPVVTKTITVYSESGLVDGSIVEIAQSKWEITQGTAVVETTVNGKNLALNPATPPAGITLNDGDIITLRVKHISLWGTESLAWSNPVTYQIGSNVNPTNSYTLNLQSGVPSGKPGINFIAIPFLSPWYVYKADGITPINVSGDSNELTTARNLVDAINANAGPTKNGAGIVKSFGRWEPTAQEDRGIMITYQIGGTMVQTPVKVGDSLENISLAPGVGFQVYVSAPTTIVIKNKQIE